MASIINRLRFSFCMNMRQCINPEPQGHVLKTYIFNFIKKYAPLYHLRHNKEFEFEFIYNFTKKNMGYSR